MFVPGFAALALFPMMSRLYINSQKDLATLYTKLINLIILIGLPASAGLWLRENEIPMLMDLLALRKP
jgi:O-antigen/teichoic acid export membrane protein